MAFNLLSAVLLALANIYVCTASTIYVKPDYHYTHCPGEPCHTLAYYVQQVSQYFVSNTTMVFLNSTHFVETMQPVVIKNVENFTMKGSDKFVLGLEDIRESSSKIECVGTHRSSFSFMNVTNIQIENLTIVNCGQKQFNDVHATLSFDEACNIIFFQVTVCNSWQCWT